MPERRVVYRGKDRPELAGLIGTVLSRLSTRDLLYVVFRGGARGEKLIAVPPSFVEVVSQ